MSAQKEDESLGFASWISTTKIEGRGGRKREKREVTRAKRKGKWGRKPSR